MIDTLVVLDDRDSRLGGFFQSCGKAVIDFVDNLAGEDRNTVEIKSRALNQLSLELQTKNFKHNFIFVSFSHGDENALLNDDKPFIQTPVKQNPLKSSFSFCFSCLSGRALGPDLIKNGTLSFIGYSDDAWVVDRVSSVFIDCAVAGLFSFYQGASVRESYQNSKKKYSEEIDTLYKTDFLAASYLMLNRDGLILHGDGSLTIKDLNY